MHPPRLDTNSPFYVGSVSNQQRLFGSIYVVFFFFLEDFSSIKKLSPKSYVYMSWLF